MLPYFDTTGYCLLGETWLFSCY